MWPYCHIGVVWFVNVTLYHQNSKDQVYLLLQRTQLYLGDNLKKEKQRSHAVGWYVFCIHPFYVCSLLGAISLMLQYSFSFK